MKNIFANEIEEQAIERIQKFAKIAKAMEFDICVEDMSYMFHKCPLEKNPPVWYK